MQLGTERREYTELVLHCPQLPVFRAAEKQHTIVKWSARAYF